MATRCLIESIDAKHVQGVFTDDATFKIPFDVDLAGVRSVEALRQKLANALADATLTQDPLVKPGPFDLTPPTPPDPPKPDPAQVALGAFIAAYQRLQSLKRKIDTGAKSDLLAQDYAAALDAFDALYVLDYAGVQ